MGKYTRECYSFSFAEQEKSSFPIDSSSDISTSFSWQNTEKVTKSHSTLSPESMNNRQGGCPRETQITGHRRARVPPRAPPWGHRLNERLILILCVVIHWCNQVFCSRDGWWCSWNETGSLRWCALKITAYLVFVLCFPPQQKLFLHNFHTLLDSLPAVCLKY